MRHRALTTLACFGVLVALTCPTASAARPPVLTAPSWSYTLQSVSGDGPGDAWAVGWRQHDQVRRTFIQHWDGVSWSTVPSPDRSPQGDNVLTGVAAISPTDAWAVGFYGSPSGYRTLVEHWDGLRWRHVPSPSGHYYSVLEDVSAVGPDDVWAVGDITKHAGQWYRGLFEHWDGTSWSMVDSTTPRRRIGGLDSVSAVDHDDIWAGAGNGFGSGAIYHFDGRWASQDEGLSGAAQSISMDSTTDGWVVGGGLTLHWDGQSWQPVSNPVSYLEAVAAYSPTDAWAAGDDFGHWDGVTWTRIDKPGPGSYFGMDMVSPDDVWAVGTSSGQAVILHWDGTGWSRSE
jgi:hypothetical protein